MWNLILNFKNVFLPSYWEKNLNQDYQDFDKFYQYSNFKRL